MGGYKSSFMGIKYIHKELFGEFLFVKLMRSRQMFRCVNEKICLPIK